MLVAMNHLECGAQGLSLRLAGRWEGAFSKNQEVRNYYNEVWGWDDPHSDRAYAIIGSADSIHFIDVSDPENAYQVDAFAGRASDASHRDIKTYRHYAYAVGEGAQGSLQIFDLQHLPDSVVKVYDHDSLVVTAHNLFVDNKRLYVAGIATYGAQYPMSVLSLEQPTAPRLITHMLRARTSIGYVHDVFVRNDTAYCAAAGDGLFRVDFTEPEAYALIDYLVVYPESGYNHSGWVHEASGRYIMADETHGTRLKVVDFHDSLPEPRVTELFGYRSGAGSIVHNPFVRDNFIFTSYYHEGVQVFSINEDGAGVRHVAGYDTYPRNDGFSPEERYRDFEGCWGVYPFFKDGLIVASDQLRGLFLFRLEQAHHVEPQSSRSMDGRPSAPSFAAPNPFRRQTVLHVPGPLFDVDVRLFDMQGRVIRVERHQQWAAETSWQAPSSLPAGTYCLELRHRSGAHYIRLQIMP